MSSVVISILGLVVALAVLLFLVMKGINIFLATFICTFIVAITGATPLSEAFRDNYMTGFTNFLKANWFMFLTGSLIGGAMRITGAAESVAKVLIKFLGTDKAVISIPIACGILAYGGVSAFVCSFAVYQIALNVFREADLPRRFMPAALCFGCSTFAMVAPGAVQIHNTIIVNELGTKMMSGTIAGFISCGFMLVAGCIALYKMVNDEKKKGFGFEEREGDNFASAANLPPFFLSLLPLIVTIATINTGLLSPEVGILLGTVLTILFFYKRVTKEQVIETTTTSIATSLQSITNTCAVVAFGAVVQNSASFPIIVEAMTSLPGPKLLAVMIGTMVIAGICGSASGGIGIAAAVLGPIFVSKGVDPAAIHRVMAVSSSSLDSLPHNGYIITVTNSLCKESHKDAYGPVCVLTVIIPFIAAIIAVALFTLFPNWP